MKYDRRLRTLARRAGRCPEHLTKFVCHTCTTVWAGTAAEWDELSGLLTRIEPYYPPTRPQGRCAVGHALLCEPCWQRDAHQTLPAMPPELISDDELARLAALLKGFQRTGAD